MYIDDIVLIGNDEKEIQRLRKYLVNEFEKKDLGSLKYFLSIEVARLRNKIFISKRKYFLDLLRETRILGCKAVDNPVKHNNKLGEDRDTLVDKGKYQQLISRQTYCLKIVQILYVQLV